MLQAVEISIIYIKTGKACRREIVQHWVQPIKQRLYLLPVPGRSNDNVSHTSETRRFLVSATEVTDSN